MHKERTLSKMPPSRTHCYLFIECCWLVSWAPCCLLVLLKRGIVLNQHLPGLGGHETVWRVLSIPSHVPHLGSRDELKLRMPTNEEVVKKRSMERGVGIDLLRVRLRRLILIFACSVNKVSGHRAEDLGQ